MKKSIFNLSLVAIAIAILASCGGSNSGPAEKVLGKKVYTQVVNKYDDVGYFVDGICIVSAGWNQYGAINNKGEEIIPTEVYAMNKVTEGMIVAKDKNYKYGVYNTKGELVVPFKYDEIEDFCEGFARIKTGGYSKTKYGFINKSGEEIITPTYDIASSSFNEGMAYVAMRDGWNYKYGFVNAKGDEVIALTFKDAQNFHDGLAVVRANNGYGYINTKGEFVTAANYDDANDFREELAVVKKDNKLSVINTKGEEQYIFPKGIIPAGSYHDGLILVCKEKSLKFGYLDKKGEIAIPLEYGAADGFNDGKALIAAVEDGECVFHYIDTKGKIVGTIEEDEYLWGYKDVEDGFYTAVEKVQQAAKSGVESVNLTEIIESLGVDALIRSYRAADAADNDDLYDSIEEKLDAIVDKVDNLYGSMVSEQLEEYIDKKIY